MVTRKTKSTGTPPADLDQGRRERTMLARFKALLAGKPWLQAFARGRIDEEIPPDGAQADSDREK